MATIKELYDQGYRNIWRPSIGLILRMELRHNNVLAVSNAICDDWEPVVEKTKKKVTLYRYTYIDEDGDIFQNNWQSWENKNLDKVIKVETKTLEYEE